ncbi:MAG TPA: hypothetical protein VF911_19865 [Thermoanaerobaculia bacterium]|jgi:hypothetical protein
MAILVLSIVFVGAAVSIALQFYSLRVQSARIDELRRQLDEHHDVDTVHRACGADARLTAHGRPCPICGA